MSGSANRAAVAERQVQRLVRGAVLATPEPDPVTVEEPLEIRIEHDGENIPLAVTMRTPGEDEDLVAGFLLSEGIIDTRADLVEVRACRELGPDGEEVENVVQVILAPSASFDPRRAQRRVATTAACGLCGRVSIDEVEVACAPLAQGVPRMATSVVLGLGKTLRAQQEAFASTGSIHATGVFDDHGVCLDLAEDVGRHNATDKVLGRALRRGEVPMTHRVLVLSGRASFEIVQKAARAGVAFVCAIGAPSSLAVDAARRFGMTLVGFATGDRFNVYSGAERITPD